MKNSVEICRANGWQVGDVLVGDDECSRGWIRITGMGETRVLARWLYADQPDSDERLVSLDFRDWRKVETP